MTKDLQAIRGQCANSELNMGKYLDEIDLLASNLYGIENKTEISKGTKEIINELNSHFHRNVSSKFGKLSSRCGLKGKWK